MQNKSNDMETKQSNMLIAEFMGAKLGKGTKDFPVVYINVPDFWSKKSASTHALEHLMYNTRWDWLMPVVEKIEAMGVNIRIEGTICLIRGGGYGAKGYDEDTKLKSTYAAVVAFITWYNDQNK